MSEKLQILKGVLGRCRTSGQEHLFHCPYCGHHKKKFSVNIDKNKYKCWVCDTKGADIYRVIRKYGSCADVQSWRVLTNKVEISDFDDIFSEEEEAKEEVIDLPPEFRSLANTNTIAAQNALNYLKKRGVSEKDILRWKIGFCDEGEYKNRIIIPSFGMSGKANFFVARSYSGDWMRYKNPKVNRNIIFNELYVDWDRDIILVEGIFDAIRAYEFGTTIPLMGSTLRVNSKLFQEIVRNASKVYIAMDDDAKDKARKVTQNLMKYGVEVYSLNTSGYEDVAEMPRDILSQRKEDCQIVNTSNQLYELIRNI